MRIGLRKRSPVINSTDRGESRLSSLDYAKSSPDAVVKSGKAASEIVADPYDIHFQMTRRHAVIVPRDEDTL